MHILIHNGIFELRAEEKVLIVYSSVEYDKYF